MKDLLRVSLITLIAFLCGAGVGIWTQRLKPIPPPPIGPFGEINFPSERKRPPISPEKAAELEEATKRLQPEIEAYQKQLDGLEQDFRVKFEALLTPEQHQRLRQILPPHLHPRPPDPRGRPGHHPQFDGGFFGALTIFTIITPAQEMLTRELGLDAGQQAQLKTLLIERRNRFLAFVDANPPPSLKLGRMVPRP